MCRIRERLGSLSGRPARPRRHLCSIALDRDNMEGGVFAANIRLERTHFRKERLDRLHIGELKESYIGRRGTVQANDVSVIAVDGVCEVLAAAFFYVGVRLGGKTTEVADPIFDIDFGPDKCWWLGLRVQDA